MFEKGQSKRYSRVSYGMSGGGEAKDKKRSKDDDRSEAAEANPYGSTKALDEATKNMRRGGMTESKKMMAKEVAFMKKKKAPKSMIAHEKAEMKGKKTKKYAVGGSAAGASKNRRMPRPANPRPTSGGLSSRNGSGVIANPRPTNSRPARTPKARPMPRPANPRPANPTRTPKARPMPRPTNSRPARTPKARPMPRPGASRPTTPRPANPRPRMKSGGKVKGYYKGGSVDGCVTKGRTRGKIK
jgi:hypothetical protein